jgi:hypothetical protein
MPAESGVAVIPAWQRGHFMKKDLRLSREERAPSRESIARSSQASPGERCCHNLRVRRASTTQLAGRIFGSSPARTLALLRAAWPLAVGPELARRTAVVGADGGTLRVRVPDAGWRKVLHRMQPDILARLRTLAGELAPRRLGFLEGEVPADPAVAVPLPEPIAPDAAAAARLAPDARRIADPEIRARFLETAALYLARTKGRDDG